MNATTVAGVDGCKGGWFAVLWNAESGSMNGRVLPDFAGVLEFAASACAVGVDMPIGLLDHARPGGRLCDVFARTLLHPTRMSCVYSPPVRGTLEAHSYAEALAVNRSSSGHICGFSKQCFGILPKIREVDRFLSPELQETVREVHPEVSFRTMNQGVTLSLPKRTLEGRAARLELLVRNGFAPLIAQLFARRAEGADPDDILDACAACWTARRIAEGTATRIPQEPHRDARGLRMEIWY